MLTAKSHGIDTRHHIYQHGTAICVKWWNSYTSTNDVGNSWRLKLQFMRQKLRGWNNNLKEN